MTPPGDLDGAEHFPVTFSYFMVLFTTFPAACKRLVELYAVAPHGLFLVPTMVASAGVYSGVLGPIVTAAGVVLVAAGAISAPGTVLPSGAAAAAAFAKRQIVQAWPTLSRGTLGQLDPQSMEPSAGADLASLLSDDTRRCKFFEYFFISEFIAWATAGALKCYKTVPGSEFDFFEVDAVGNVEYCELKVITAHVHWDVGSAPLASTGAYRHYAMLRLGLTFGNNPTRALPSGAILDNVYVGFYQRQRRRLSTWKVRASSLARPAATVANPNPDPNGLWFDMRAGKYVKRWTATSHNVCIFDGATGALHPFPETPTFLSMEAEDIVYNWLDDLLMGTEGSAPTAAIVGAPGKRLPHIDF